MTDSRSASRAPGRATVSTRWVHEGSGEARTTMSKPSRNRSPRRTSPAGERPPESASFNEPRRRRATAARRRPARAGTSPSWLCLSSPSTTFFGHPSDIMDTFCLLPVRGMSTAVAGSSDTGAALASWSPPCARTEPARPPRARDERALVRKVGWRELRRAVASTARISAIVTCLQYKLFRVWRANA